LPLILLKGKKKTKKKIKKLNERIQLAQNSGKSGVFWDWDVPNNTLTWEPQHVCIIWYRRKKIFGGAYEAWAKTVCIPMIKKPGGPRKSKKALKRRKKKFDTSFLE
jgi:hypothetical protein